MKLGWLDGEGDVIIISNLLAGVGRGSNSETTPSACKSLRFIFFFLLIELNSSSLIHKQPPKIQVDHLTQWSSLAVRIPKQ